MSNEKRMDYALPPGENAPTDISWLLRGYGASLFYNKHAIFGVGRTFTGVANKLVQQ